MEKRSHSSISSALDFFEDFEVGKGETEIKYVTDSKGEPQDEEILRARTNSPQITTSRVTVTRHSSRASSRDHTPSTASRARSSLKTSVEKNERSDDIQTIKDVSRPEEDVHVDANPASGAEGLEAPKLFCVKTAKSSESLENAKDSDEKETKGAPTPEQSEQIEEEVEEQTEEDQYSDDFDEGEDKQNSTPPPTNFSEITADDTDDQEPKHPSYRTSSMPVAKASPVSTAGYSASTVLGLCDKQSQDTPEVPEFSEASNNVSLEPFSEASNSASLEPFESRNVYVLTDPSVQDTNDFGESINPDSCVQIIKTPVGTNSKRLSSSLSQTPLPKISSRSIVRESAKAASAIYSWKLPGHQGSKSWCLPKIPRQLKSEAMYRDGVLEIRIHGLPAVVPEKYSSTKYNLDTGELPVPVSLVFLAGKKEAAKKRAPVTYTAKQLRHLLFRPDRNILETRAAWPAFNTKIDSKQDERPRLHKGNISPQIPRRAGTQSRGNKRR